MTGLPSQYASKSRLAGVLFAGLPAIVVPCGFEKGSGSKGQSLPVGLQIIGRGFGEADIIKFAHIFEQTIGLADMHPSLQ